MRLLASLILLMAAPAFAADAKDPDPLAELSAMGNTLADNSQQGGGSIRAKRDVDASFFKRTKDPKNFEAKVEMVQQGKFPGAVVQLRVVVPAKEGPGKDLAKNDAVVVIPRYKVEKGQFLMTDPDTLINAGSFYLQNGDRVAVRLGQKRDKLWEAEYIERM